MHKINTATFDLNLLTVFLVLWETRSVTRASDRLAVSQPAVSHALRRLRDAMGDELFVNAKGGLVPTPRGEALIDPVREALGKINFALTEQDTFIPSLAQRQFNIAAGDLVEFSILPQLVEQIGKLAPGIMIRIAPIPDGPLANEQLESGALDAIIGARSFRGTGVINETLAQISVATLIWKRENLGKRRFPLPLYVKRPHVVIRTADRQGTIVDQTLAERGLQRQIGAVVQNFMTMPMVAARTGYICNVPSSMAETFADLFDLSVHEPPIAFPPTPMFISWHKRFDGDAAHVWMLEQIRSAVATV
ncbi:Nodulation protein D 2 [Paraburkholderia domus]|uniref:LysR family transcriptional regulator n=1 Tax=Paraburkholderia domus TaxID=2793075 RepID=UPI00191359BA|nr:LysR family transcriptional regulator [Paraburkholderia domus]MBK5050505.1 LysR family transcriptional regulator [Burkholderia sp. R-70006]CAE6753563.1 Nodulation protein D 2 [Paraburkholderia domus]